MVQCPVMPRGRCLEPGCGKPTEAVIVEEGLLNSHAQTFPATGVVWCPTHGLIETTSRAGRSGPVRLGRLIKTEVEREFPRGGERVWREADGTTPSEMMRRGEPNTYFVRVAGVRWDRTSSNIVPMRNLGAGYFVRPVSIGREHRSLVPREVEDNLR